MKKLFIIALINIGTFQLVVGQAVENYSNALMPWPKNITFGEGKFEINTDFIVSIDDYATKRLYNASTRFIRRLSGRTGVFLEHGFPFEKNTTSPSLKISVKREGKLALFEDESYEIVVDKQEIKLTAESDIGALRGLETILQLLTANSNHFYIPSVTITDAPRFPWRGLMIDVARHYQPVHVLKRNLDAMAAVKLNVFHWHLTDDQGFRVESKTHPKLHELGSDGQYYTHYEIRDVVQYASDRGIRVIPEFDVPGHATAILTAYPELGSKDTIYKIERHAGIFNPTLDPTNEKTYQVLKDLFKEMATLFPDHYVHIGGDENEGKHWDENDKIVAFKKKHGFETNHDLQTYFNLKLQKILEEEGKKLVGWEEIMTPEMPVSAVIHSWRGINEGVEPGASLIEASKKGHHGILSTGYYIDRMHNIEDHYLVDPIPDASTLTDLEQKHILGGEVTMWSELVTPLTLDSRIWPRTAAIAERFWSPIVVRDVQHMKKRLSTVSFRLEELGITHLRNRDVILRNIANGNTIDGLVKLTKVCQPLKVYARNKGGTEYKSYSPFTLFADACTTDASDAIIFDTLVDEYAAKPNRSRASIKELLHSWIQNHNDLQTLDTKTPLVNEVLKLSFSLKEISSLLLKIIEKDSISKDDNTTFTKLLKEAKQPHADVELVVNQSFMKLFEYFKNGKKNINEQTH